MAFIEPTVDNTSTWDDFNRSDGNAYDSAGATLWDTEAFPGSGSNPLDIDSNALKTGTAEAWGSTLSVEGELAKVITLKVAPGGNPDYFAFAWGVVDSTHLYKLLITDSAWRIYRTNGTDTELAASGQSPVGSGSDDRILVMHTDLGGIEVYRETSGVWNETAVLASAQTVVEGVQAINLQSTVTRVETIEDVNLSGPAEPVTMYVNADHADASDEYTRTQAADPDTPFASIGRAMEAAFSKPAWLEVGDGLGDQIVVVKSETDANPEDEFDTGVYPGVYHVRDNFGDAAPTLPFGDNSGNAPIVVRAATVGTFETKWLGVSGRFLRNWVFEDFQIGYDPGDLQVRTRNQFGQAEDLTFRRCWFTRGGFELLAFTGTILVEDCVTNAPLPPSVIVSDGRGFGIGYLPDYAEGAEGTGLMHFKGCRFEGIHGNDCIQAGMGAYDDTGSHLLIEDCVFIDVYEGAGFEDFFHCDGIQMQGGHKLTVRRCAFFGCSDAVICSDYRNSLVTIEGCLMVSHGGQVQMQGYDHFIFRNNTVIHLGTFGIDVSILFYSREPSTDLKFTCVNNIMNALEYRDSGSQQHGDGSVIDQNIMLLEPGADTGFGQNLSGIPEYGSSARTADYPTTLGKFPDLTLTGAYELANTAANAAIGAGLNLASTPEGALATDIQGRSYTNPPDLGAFQSSPGTPVSPAARSPYLVSRSPAPGATGVSRNTSVVMTLYPKPGETIDPATATANSVYIVDAAGQTLPAVISVSDLEGGYQDVTIDIKSDLSPLTEGTLLQLSEYTPTLTDTVKDTEGSPVLTTSWTFRTAGPAGPAVDSADQPVNGWTIGYVT